MVKADKLHFIIVLPASHQADFKALKKILQAKKVDIDKENVMTKLFKVKSGAISALHGPLYKIPVYIDKAVMKVHKVVAQAGSFEESIHLKTKDLLKAVEGKLGSFSKRK